MSLWALLAGSALGALLLVIPSQGAAAALQRFPARAYWFAGAEFIFSALCMLVLAAAWRSAWGRRWLGVLIALLTSTNLLYHFPPLMGVFGRLVVQPTWAQAATLHRPELLQLMGRPEILALSVHFALASLTTALMAAGWIVSKQVVGESDARDSAEDVQAARRFVRQSYGAALAVTVVQLGSGVWLLVALTAVDRGRLLGGQWPASLVFAAGLFSALKLLERLGVVTWGADLGKGPRQAMHWLVLTVVLMTASLWASRRGTVEVDRTPTHGQGDASTIGTVPLETRATLPGRPRAL